MPDVALDPAALARSRKVGALLQPTARAKLDSAVSAVLARLSGGTGNPDPYALARSEVLSRFAQLSRDQMNLLSFYVLVRVAQLISRASSSGRRGGLGASPNPNLVLERTSRSALAVDEILRKLSDVKAAMIQNLK
jgi:hypothetical protein